MPVLSPKIILLKKASLYTQLGMASTIVPSHNASGRVTGVILYSIDETRLRAQEIEEEREKLQIIFDHADMTALALFDAPTARLIMGSPRYMDIVSRLHKLDRDQLVGRTWQELTVIRQDNTQDDTQDSLWATLLESRKSQRLAELHLRLALDNQNDQDSIWDWTLTPIYMKDDQDTVRYALISAVEITEQVQIRQEVERLNLLKDEFISLASHELRTPLTSIMGNTEFLQRGVRRQLNGENGANMANNAEASRNALELQQHTLESILHQSRRLNSLINEMLDIARVHGEQLELHNQEQVPLVALVRRAIETQATVSRRRILLETNTEEITGTWDDARIEQVVNNLLTNAVKYSSASEPITVHIEHIPDEVIVSVHDNGQGISEEQQAHIFDRYYRARTEANTGVEGLGLGLYISREIVTLQGGRMWLESGPGEGSTFYFSLPLG